MKLINTMLVGVFAFSMLFAQPPTGGQQPPPGGQGGPPAGGPPQGGPPPGGAPDGAPGGPPQGGPDGDMQNKSAADHFMMAIQEGMDRGVLDANDQEYLMGMVPKMKEAVDSEYNDGADGAAGEVVDEFEEWLQGLYDEGGESAEVAQRLAMELCMVESEAHRMNDPDGDHDDMECQPQGGPDGPQDGPQGGPQGGPDGPSPASVDAFFSAGQQPNGFFDFDAAFDAAESTAKAEAQEAGEYDEESWDECADVGREAMESARADNKSPQEVFQSIAEAVNACGEAQGEDYDDGQMDDDYDDQDQFDGPMGPNFDQANCMALEDGAPAFWVDKNQNGEKDDVTMDDVAGTQYEGEPWRSPNYEGPYGTYDEYEDGTPVTCGGPQGGPQGGPDGPQDGPQGGPDGPSPASVDAFFSAGQQPNGFFDFDAAFDAAESTAKAEAQEAGEYDEESWDECADVGREAMESARADNKSPQEVFQSIAEAVNACGEAQAAANQD